MIKKIIALCFFTVMCCFFTKAQDSIPILSGKVSVSIKKGTIDCDLTLSNIPRINDYVIRINSGMNILHFKNLTSGNLIYFDKSSFDTLSSGETLAYYFTGVRGKGKFLPRAVQFRYVGMFPVVKDTLGEVSVEDWRGNIAFNGYSLRADGAQSGWYPMLYDIKRQILYNKVKYDLQIICSDCNTLYINGNIPVKAKTHQFKSDVPAELTMFPGKYKTSNIDGTYILNPDASDKELSAFAGITNEYKNYYAENLQIPYKTAITYIQTTPTSKHNGWLFVSYPTILNIGWGDGFKSFTAPKTSGWFRPYIAHELGHYYFGEVKRFNSELGDMMSEGFAEFLSLKVAKKFVNDSVYNGKISKKIKDLKNFTPVAFAKIKSNSDYNDRELYVYYYAPLIFTAIEKEIGEKAMWAWMKTILETPADFTNYGFMEQTFAIAVPDATKAARLKAKYFESDHSLENAIAEIQ